MNAIKATGLALAAVLAIAGGVAGAARLAVDVPPDIDGEELHLLVEVRWAAGQRPPDTTTGTATIRLGALSGSTIRSEAIGPLFLDDARLEGAQWIVPGVVEIFTTRGTRVVNVFVGTTQITSFLPPLRRFPRREDMAWSEWRPAAPEGRQVIGTPVSYRYRVSPRSAPVRWQTVGPLIIETRISEVFNTDGTDALSAHGSFTIRHQGQPVAGLGEPQELAVVSTTPLGLLARSPSSCHIVKMSASGPVVDDAPPCRDDGPSWKLGRAAATGQPLRGWLDRETFREPGLYLLGPALLDTRTLTITPRGWPGEPTHVQDLPPLGLSPDAKTMAWFSPGNGYDTPAAVAAMRLDTGTVTTLPIDRTRMRYRSPQLDIDGAWLAHHFAWIRGDDAIDHLETRTDFMPLPHRGALSEPKPGDYQAYDIGPGGPRLQAAVVEILVQELRGTTMAEEFATVNASRVEIDGTPISVQYVDGGASVSVHSYKSRPDVMARIAAHLDTVLASGRLDALLVEDPR
jgi:hypothetical protein